VRKNQIKHNSLENLSELTIHTGRFARGVIEYFSIDARNPELLKAQCAALSRLIPLLYFILVVNSWMLAASFYHTAPIWLTIYVSLGLTAICAFRLVVWWRTRGETLTAERALRELRRTPRLTAVLGIGFTTWAAALFPFGDAYAQGHVVFYMTISVISTMFCLIHVRSAALILASTAGTIIVAFLLSQETLTFTAIAINITLVTAATVIVILIQSRDFVRMVEGRKRSDALSAENFRLANLDSLTGLPNRRAFFSRLTKSLKDAEMNSYRVAVGIIDLDGFKPVNDLYGHATGDKLLIEVGSRLLELNRDPNVFISRLGGDEFAFVIDNAPHNAAVLDLGEAMGGALRIPFHLTEATVQISGSVGMAVYPEIATTTEQIFERADYALYHGKSSRRGRAVLFSDEHAAQINSDARIEQALKLANFDDEFMVVFQPIVDLGSQTTIGFEALARWSSPTLGKVPPSQFIPVAERAGIIGQLTRPLLRKALSTAISWEGDIRLSFNLSAYDLNSPEGVLALVSIIEGSGFDPRRLDLEITETAFTHDFEQVEKSISMLRLLGCGISLDDFGTGYSSLTRLHALPLTKIKIDRSFVTDLHKSPVSYKIVKSLLALSRDMGLDCVVEGVETREEMAALKKLGGIMVQGYYYSPPIPDDETFGFLLARLNSSSPSVISRG